VKWYLHTYNYVFYYWCVVFYVINNNKLQTLCSPATSQTQTTCPGGSVRMCEEGNSCCWYNAIETNHKNEINHKNETKNVYISCCQYSPAKCCGKSAADYGCCPQHEQCLTYDGEHIWTCSTAANGWLFCILYFVIHCLLFIYCRSTISLIEHSWRASVHNVTLYL
jgi:hypothetical protein